MMTQGRVGTLAVALAAVSLVGCGGRYVTHDEFDATIGELQENDARLARDMQAAKLEMASLHGDLESRFQMQDVKFQKYDAAMLEERGRLRVDVATYFDNGRSTLRDEDKPALDDFAAVIRENHPDTLITVEGFTDVAGTSEANRRLGLRRARAVRDYLVENGGLPAERVRAVSYGAARNRQIKPGAIGAQGEINRRVALVVDYAAPAVTDQQTAQQSMPQISGSN